MFPCSETTSAKNCPSVKWGTGGGAECMVRMGRQFLAASLGSPLLLAKWL